MVPHKNAHAPCRIPRPLQARAIPRLRLDFPAYWKVYIRSVTCVTWGRTKRRIRRRIAAARRARAGRVGATLGDRGEWAYRRKSFRRGGARARGETVTLRSCHRYRPYPTKKQEASLLEQMKLPAPLQQGAVEAQGRLRTHGASYHLRRAMPVAAGSQERSPPTRPSLPACLRTF